MRQPRNVIAAIADQFTLWQIAAILFAGPAAVIAALRSLTGWSWPWLVILTVAPALVAVIGTGVIAVRRQSAAQATNTATVRVAEAPRK